MPLSTFATEPIVVVHVCLHEETKLLLVVYDPPPALKKKKKKKKNYMLLCALTGTLAAL